MITSEEIARIKAIKETMLALHKEMRAIQEKCEHVELYDLMGAGVLFKCKVCLAKFDEERCRWWHD